MRLQNTKNGLLLIICLLMFIQAYANDTQIESRPCSLTCNNDNYLKPGNQRVEPRQLPPIRKEVNAVLKEAFNNLIPPKENKKAKINPKKALSILEKHKIQNLNENEAAQVHLFKAYSYKALENSEKAVEEFLLVIDASPNIDAETEIDALESVIFDYSLLNNPLKAVNLVERWAKLTDEIAYEDYKLISKIYEEYGHLPKAIANLARAIEIMDVESDSPLIDYIRLTNLYVANDQILEAETIRITFMANLPGNGLEDGEPIPIRVVAHEYPAEALEKRIEGKCKVTFTVTAQGTTKDIHIKPGDCRTPDNNPTEYFSEPSMYAVKKFVYRPKIENGKAVEVKNVTFKFTYRMAE